MRAYATLTTSSVQPLRLLAAAHSGTIGLQHHHIEVTVISYEELASGLEDSWLLAGLHDHVLSESVQPDLLERVYRVELFPEHAEPLLEGSSPPWVEVSFTWTASHQLHSEGRETLPGILELAWTYTVGVRNQSDRSDIDLVRAFNAAVRAALRRAAPDLPTPTEYLAVEVRRGYTLSGERPTTAYVQLVGTNVTDLGDLWNDRAPNAVRDALRDELIIAAALLHSLGEAFTPSGLGGYRAVDTA